MPLFYGRELCDLTDFFRTPTEEKYLQRAPASISKARQPDTAKERRHVHTSGFETRVQLRS
jgi:hypothetical protein